MESDQVQRGVQLDDWQGRYQVEWDQGQVQQE